MPDASPEYPPSARALLRERDYLLFWLSRWTGGMAAQIQSVALGWHIYALARKTMSVEQSALVVGMVGLAAFIPVLLLTLPAGEAVDRYDRRKLMTACYLAELATVAVLVAASWREFATVPLLLGVAATLGA